MSSDVHLRAILLEISQPSVTKISYKIVFLRFYLNLPGANELRSFSCWKHLFYAINMELWIKEKLLPWTDYYSMQIAVPVCGYKVCLQQAETSVALPLSGVAC